MSLWEVPDEATQLLMQNFYTNLWEKKLSKFEALRLAQETVRNERRFKSSIYWAAWILAGEVW